ncbi:MAG: c-type cytochrome, partial [Gemmataceae bacterium]|nr:c-type cytochrome [Gemmataceae bacterium]
SDNKDFHPTDVIEDADGSLLVIDTGGWYKLCCPTSQLVKPDVLGAIYRVRKVSTKPHDDPYGLRIDWDDTKSIARCLADPRAFVRKRAIDLAGQRGDVMLPELTAIMQTGTVETQRNALWAATRIISVKARAFVRDYGLAAKDASVVRVALHSISVHRDAKALAGMLPILRSMETPAAVMRVAGEAIGRIHVNTPLNPRAAVLAIFDRLAETNDRVLEHSLTFALIEMNDCEAVAFGLKDDRPAVRRAALVVLDQLDAGKLEASTVVKELSASDPKLRETAWWIASRHPEWSASLGKALRQRLAAKLPTDERRELIEQLAKLSKAKATQALLVDVLGDNAATVESRIAVLHAMAQSPLKEAPSTWLDAMRVQLRGDQPMLRLEAARTLRAMRLPKTIPAELLAELRAIGDDAKADAATRLTALAVLPAGTVSPSSTLFGFLLKEVHGDQPVLQRSLAAEVLSKAKLDGVQLAALATNLPKIGPMEVDRLLDAFAQTIDDKLGAMLVKSLQAPELRTVLREDAVKLRLAKFSAKIRKDAEPLLKTLNADVGKQQARLEDLLTKLPVGDVRRGMTVFNHAKSACMACHAIGYVGGKTGPDLTRIGSIRTERDLLESIIFPSASFVRGYEPIVITTKNGLTHNGLVRKDSADELHLAIGVNQDLRVSRTEIEEIRPSRVSIMPAGLDQQLTLQQLADLIAFLKACR